MRAHRREFLRWASIATGAAASGGLLSCTKSPGASEPDAMDVYGADAGVCTPTISDLQGPFFEAGAPLRMQIAKDSEPGERLQLQGVVQSDSCTALAGVLLDVWQADRDGNYHDAGAEFRLRGQLLTGSNGRFEIETIKPGNYTIGANSWRPAHIHFTISKPGFVALTTQLYFAGDPYLAPNDGCGAACGSDDPARIIELSGDAQNGWSGEFQVVLAAS